MGKLYNDIDDDQIRIINSDSSKKSSTDDRLLQIKSDNGVDRRNGRMRIIVAAILAVVIIIVLILALHFANGADSSLTGGQEGTALSGGEQNGSDGAIQLQTPSDGTEKAKSKGYVDIRDTIIGKEPLVIFTPRDAIPTLKVGKEALNTENAVLITQAADVRQDNRQIGGAYVVKGDLVSRGQAKAGFCAIIDGQLTVGVATSTPYLEQAIENGGYFFRQYPLVAGGQAVDNRLKLSSLRRALAILNGEPVVIMTQNKMTLNEFAQILVDLGVSEAIYTIGSSSYGFARDKEGKKIEFGNPNVKNPTNVNYIIWQ